MVQGSPGFLHPDMMEGQGVKMDGHVCECSYQFLPSYHFLEISKG